MQSTLYQSPSVKVTAIEEPTELVNESHPFYGQTTETTGVVYYTVETRSGRHSPAWLTYAELAAPMFDKTLRSAAATEALRLADEAA